MNIEKNEQTLEEIIRTNERILRSLLKEYRKHKKPLKVDFREIVNGLPSGERATHFIHSYPAKLLYHIPYFFLNNNILSKPGDIVLDPFCGTGTVMLESLLSGRNGVGFDVNPLACLIAEVKTTKIHEKDLVASIKKLRIHINSSRNSVVCEKNLTVTYWFYPRIIKQLTILKEAILKIHDEKIKKFALVSFSSLIRKVSLADPRISVPVKLNFKGLTKKHPLSKEETRRLNWLKRVDVYELFYVVLDKNVKRIAKLEGHSQTSSVIVKSDFRQGRLIKSGPEQNSVSLVITSPPYSGAQKYVRASKLNLAWLKNGSSVDFQKIELQTIGREHYQKKEYETQVATGLKEADNFLKEIRKSNPLRAHIAGTYLLEMRESLKEIYSYLKKGGHLVIVIGDNSICGKRFLSHEYVGKIAEEIGFKSKLKLIDDIRSRGLMTKRNKTASMITEEWILIFQK